ncbi:MAG: (2Fe-2S) ferredoxin domain-containing protein [Rhodospirillales bacterium]
MIDGARVPKPYYRAHVFCCVNRRPADNPLGSCAAKGAERLRNYMKARAKELKIEDIRINQAGCLDRCEHGPTMVIYPEGVWYTYTSFADVDEILQSHLIEGHPVERLMIDRPAGP